MKAVVVYVKGHEVSEQHKDRLVASLDQYGWDYELWEGVTPDTIEEEDFPFKDLEGGRLQSFKTNEPRKYPIKKSCVFNHLYFAQRVLYDNEPMIFLEHDQLVCAPPPEIIFRDYCQLNTEYAFKPPSVLANYPQFVKWDNTSPKLHGAHEFGFGYPLKYYKHSIYHNKAMVPGTGAYALSPSGAKKLLDAAKRNGLEQSDFFYNEGVLNIETLFPSPVKFQDTNPNLSHGL